MSAGPGSDVVGLAVTSGLATITLQAPHRRNALTPDIARGVLAALETVNADGNVGALIVTGEGPAFCAGGDLSWIRGAAADPLGPAADHELTLVYSMFAALQGAAVPTIAAVGGAVVGAGLNLALACDVRIVGDDLRAAGFGRAGIHPGGGHLEMLYRHVGHQTSAALAFFGQEMDAGTSVRVGFALESVARDRMMARARELASPAVGDADLSRRVTATFRALRPAADSTTAAGLVERGGQLWSLRRPFPVGEAGDSVKQT